MVSSFSPVSPLPSFSILHDCSNITSRFKCFSILISGTDSSHVRIWLEGGDLRFSYRLDASAMSSTTSPSVDDVSFDDGKWHSISIKREVTQVCCCETFRVFIASKMTQLLEQGGKIVVVVVMVRAGWYNCCCGCDGKSGVVELLFF